MQVLRPQHVRIVSVRKSSFLEVTPTCKHGLAQSKPLNDRVWNMESTRVKPARSGVEFWIPEQNREELPAQGPEFSNTRRRLPQEELETPTCDSNLTMKDTAYAGNSRSNHPDCSGVALSDPRIGIRE
jgi:hypothetical protein